MNTFIKKRLKLRCSCGGNDEINHILGGVGCLRIEVPRDLVPREPRYMGMVLYWVIEDSLVSDHDLRNRRLYCYHMREDKWSMPKSKIFH